jgi:putative addiction module component (TIGR02574 family)
MSRDLRDQFRDVFELPESERATLAGLLIESLDPPPDRDVEELWAAEEERRWREIESGAVETVPWEEVRARLFRRRG